MSIPMHCKYTLATAAYFVNLKMTLHLSPYTYLATHSHIIEPNLLRNANSYTLPWPLRNCNGPNLIGHQHWWGISLANAVPPPWE